MSRPFTVTAHYLKRCVPWLAVLVMISCQLSGAEPLKSGDKDQVERLQDPTNPSASINVGEIAESYLSALKREKAKPSEPIFGMDEGPIDSGYRQCVTIESLYDNSLHARQEDLIELRRWTKEALNRKENSSKDLHDWLILFIGYTGDKSVVPQLIDILLNHPEGYMRFEAAKALGHTKDRSSIPALQRALKTDTYSRYRLGSCLIQYKRKENVFSPTRVAAAEALKSMGVSVPRGAEILDRKYIVPRIEPLLYSKSVSLNDIVVFAAIGGPDAEQALSRFIESLRKKNKSDLAEFTESMLEKSKELDKVE